jgi:hypothetical protein
LDWESGVIVARLVRAARHLWEKPVTEPEAPNLKDAFVPGPQTG